MNTVPLTREQVLAGYDAVSPLYGHIPPLCMGRSWEFAGYRRFALPEPVLDVGCGDGRFFRLVWPGAADVSGVDINPASAERSRRIGVYRDVHVAPADRLPFAPGSFASAFANCALEHMDRLPDVLAAIARALRPGGTFLLSVETDKYIDWSTLPLLLALAGAPERAAAVQKQHDAYHHHVNVLKVVDWVTALDRAGFDVREHVPIVPEISSRLLLFFDHLWHLPRPNNPLYPGGEVGNELHPVLVSLPDFPAAFRHVFDGVLRMERDWSTGSGAIFRATRR